MKMRHIFSIVAFLFLLTSCIEIIDDITINKDGTGTMSYMVNLSSSKVKINSILALDSIKGKPVPEKAEIKAKILEFKTRLEEQEGITNVNLSSDFANYLFKFSCDFNSLENLQNGIKTVVVNMNEMQQHEAISHNWIIMDSSCLERSIPELTINKAEKWKSEDISRMKQGTYTSITRFETPILSSENQKAKISKNQKAIMLQTDPYSLLKNPRLLDNRINLGNFH